MSYFLLSNINPHTTGPNGKPHYYLRRNMPVLFIGLHITASLEGLHTGPDVSAEQTARYAATTDRPVSWHSGSDTDTCLQLLPASCTAFACKGYNACGYHHEFSKSDTNWLDSRPLWVADTLAAPARHLRDVALDHRVPIRKASKEELDDAMATFRRSGRAQPVGFIGHHELDPARRTDPGIVGREDTFPWKTWLALLRQDPKADLEEDDMPKQRYQVKGDRKQYVLEPHGAVHINSGETVRRLTAEGRLSKDVKEITPAQLAELLRQD